MERLERAVRELNKAEFCCILEKNNQLYKAQGIGVKPIMTWLGEDMSYFANGAVADKVIGKAAALLLILGKAAAVYGTVMSESAVKVLEANGVSYAYGTLVPYIENRSHDGHCPLEKAVADIDDPQIAYAAIKETVMELMSQK